MTDKSVTITKSERQSLLSKARQMFNKTALIQHPNVNFEAEFTKQIIKRHMCIFDEFLTSSIRPYINNVRTNYEFSNKVQSVSLPRDFYIKSLENGSGTMLCDHSNLREINFTDVGIEPKYINEDDTVLFPLNFSKAIVLTDEEKEQILNFNQSMIDVFEPLNAQLTAVTTAITLCRTTKTFTARLPNLVGLFPESLKRKLANKNDAETDKELTEEEKLIKAATNMIATANLLDD